MCQDMAAITRKLVDGYREMVAANTQLAPAVYFPVPRSFLKMRLTISEAVRSISFESDPLGRVVYLDHSTWRDFSSTRNTVPLVRPNVELRDRLACFASGSTIDPARRFRRECRQLLQRRSSHAGGAEVFLTGSGFGIISSQLRFKRLSDVVRQNGVGELRIGHDAKHAAVGQAIRQELVESASHRQNVHAERTPARSAADARPQDNKGATGYNMRVESRFIPSIISIGMGASGLSGSIETELNPHV